LRDEAAGYGIREQSLAALRYILVSDERPSRTVNMTPGGQLSEELGHDWTGRNILVTGGLGFLGSHLSATLLEAGANVVVVDNDVVESRMSLLRIHHMVNNPKLEIVELDVCDRAAVDALFMARTFDVVFHMAAYSVIERATKAPFDALTTNAMGTLHILDAIRRFSPADTRFVQASTDKVYGEMDGSCYFEDSPLRGIGIYDAGKLAADVTARSYYHTFGTPTSVLRLCNVFGPHDYNSGYRLFPKSLSRIFADETPSAPVLYYNSIGHWRDYVYVDDAVRAFLTLATHPLAIGEAFNMAAATHMSTPVVLKLLVEAAVTTLKDVDPARAAAVESNGIQIATESTSALTIQRQHLDADKIATKLGFTVNTTFSEGVLRTVEHHAHHLVGGLASVG
jgi:nucleoside-diphosphate-sugar epimerase